MIKTVLVEDEKKSLKTLQTLLDRYCPEVEVSATAACVSEGKKVIEKIKPELVFLDIAMPDGDAFDLLNSLGIIDFDVVFITAYNDFALKAFDFSALHYILKPLNHTELVEAVNRFRRSNPNNQVNERIEILNQSLQKNYAKISLPTTDGLMILEIDQIIRIEADSNYSQFMLKDGDSVIVSKPMNYFEELLNELHFCRVHNTHIINLNYVKKYSRGRGGLITLSDGSQIAVSANRKKQFLSRLNDEIYSIK